MNTFWWKRPNSGNFGDELSPIIFQKMFGLEAEWSELGGRVLGIGTILGYARDGDCFWGSGCGLQNGLSSKNIIGFAARGPLTRNECLKFGIPCPEIYGDPAVFLPKIFRPNKSQSGIGIVPHHQDLEIAIDRFKNSDFKIISPLLDPKSFVKELTQCKVVLSTALHGLIAADVYEIPSVFVRLVIRDEITYGMELRGTFKYDDYYLGVGKNPVIPKYILSPKDVKPLAEKATFIKIKVDKKRLLESFPMERAKNQFVL